MKSIAILLLIFSVSSHAKIGKPKPVPTHPTHNSPKGYGQFEADQKRIRNFMAVIGWDEETTFEETGLLMKDLLLELGKKDKDSKKWMDEVIVYMDSDEFQNQTKVQKKEDIFKAKLYAKMAIHQFVLIPESYEKN